MWIVIQKMPLNSIIGDITPGIAKLETCGDIPGRNPTAVSKNLVSSGG